MLYCITMLVHKIHIVNEIFYVISVLIVLYVILISYDNIKLIII